MVVGAGEALVPPTPFVLRTIGCADERKRIDPQTEHAEADPTPFVLSVSKHGQAKRRWWVMLGKGGNVLQPPIMVSLSNHKALLSEAEGLNADCRYHLEPAHARVILRGDHKSVRAELNPVRAELVEAQAGKAQVVGVLGKGSGNGLPFDKLRANGG